MIIFNGMYFRGSWKHPFDVVEPGTFYKSNTEKKQVPMMKTKGTFKTGSLPGLDSTAIELPYDVSENSYNTSNNLAELKISDHCLLATVR